MSEDRDERVFRYRPAWQKWALALAIMIGWTWYHLSFGYGTWVVEEPLGPLSAAYLAMIALFVGGLGLLPTVSLLLFFTQGHITVTDERLRWRTWWSERVLSWDEIRAVGEPSDYGSWRGILQFWLESDQSIRIVTDQRSRDIPSGLLRENGDSAYEAIADAGGFTESFDHDGRTFRCRPGWTPEELPQRHPWRRVPN
ncbi:MAG: hypothetical protein R6V07_13495 [Armatimonadota bacterium]